MKLLYNMRAKNYILWKWLLFFGTVFWVALCLTDGIYRKIVQDTFLNADDRLDDAVKDIYHLEEVEEVKDNPFENEENHFWNAVSIVLLIAFFMSFKLKNGLFWNYLVNEENLAIESSDLYYVEPHKPHLEEKYEVIETASSKPARINPIKDLIIKDLRINKLEELALEEFPEIPDLTNKKPSFSPSVTRPPSRSMRPPSVDVRFLQAKLEKLEKSVSAMRKRRPGIVSGTKEFQQFLTELKPSQEAFVF